MEQASSDKTDINNILEKHNSSVEKIIGKLLPGLDATRDIKDRDGDVLETVPDWSARTKVGTLILTAAGLMKQSSVEVNLGLSQEEKAVEELYKQWRQANRN